jgi:cadmium resistance protein CadD (predicted permease)
VFVSAQTESRPPSYRSDWSASAVLAANETATPGATRSHMSFGLYATGFAIVIAGLIYGAYLMHMPAHWIAVGGIILLGVGILSAVKATRQKDPAG